MHPNSRPRRRSSSPRPIAFALLLAALLGPRAASPALAQGRWEEMDYGPFLSSSVTMPGAHPEDPKGIVEKGITVKLDGGKAAVCFDTDLLCYSAGWTGGWLKLMGTPFDGTHRPPEGSRPAPAGDAVFQTKETPGWAQGESFNDPRKRPYGPLPKEWAKYKGLYVHGQRVVFSYSVGDVDVLESPGIEYVDGVPIFTRTFRVAPSENPLTAVLYEPAQADAQAEGLPAGVFDGKATLGDITAAVVGLLPPQDSRVFVSSGVRLTLHVTARPDPLTFKLAITKDLKNLWDRILPTFDDPSSFIRGGPARHPQAVQTQGKLGSGDGPYAVDTLTLPDDNPWKSWMRVGGFDFFKDGKRAALSTWSGDVWVVDGIDEALEKLTWRRYATGLFQPLGLKIVDEKIYVLGRDQITRLHDLNDDGEADFYENFNNDVEVTPNFHEFGSDLHTDPEGNFYFVKGAPLLGTHEFDPIGAHNGCVLKVSRDGKKLEVFATGLRAPNGCGVGPGGEVTTGDNQGIWTPACRINWAQPGGFYGCMGTHHRATAPADYDPPLCWLPMSVDNSSGGQVWVTSDKWGLPRGELLHLSYGKCKLFHVLREDVAGQMQGGVVRFPLSFASGIMRGRFNPADGQLYVAGLRGWQTDGSTDGCLQRVRYTGKPLRALASMRVTPKGIDLTFTDPLNRETAADAGSYAAEQWDYKWTKEYGSPEFKPSAPEEQGHDTVEIKSATLSADGKTVSLGIPGLRPVMQMMIRLNVETADGAPVELEVHNTINKVP